MPSPEEALLMFCYGCHKDLNPDVDLIVQCATCKAYQCKRCDRCACNTEEHDRTTAVLADISATAQQFLDGLR